MRPRLTVLRILILWIGWFAGVGLSAQNTLFLPCDATSLTDKQKASNPERLAYPTDLINTVRREVSFACTQPIDITHPFSVSPDRQVLFSPGNLQYNAALGTHQCADGSVKPGTWRFAEHQWDYVGDAKNGTVWYNGTKCDNTQVSESYDGWIDLFGWGTSGWESGANAYQPWATSENNADYYPGGTAGNDLTGSYANADWGVYNAIGNDPAGTWRTLTRDEWVYLLHERENAKRLFGTGTVNGVQGTIILPDDWSLPSGVSFTPSTEKGLVWEGGQYTNANNDNYSHNTYTTAQWNIMETSGAIFIPTGGRRDSNTVKNASLRGFCWSSSAGEDGVTYILRFTTDALYPQHVSNPYRGRGVRLVKDSVVTPTYVPKPFSVSANKQVTFSPGNLQYNAAQGSHLCADGTTQSGTWRFAEHQWDYVGDAKNGTVYYNGTKCDNTQVSESYDGWIDLFGWGTSGWESGAAAYQPWAVSTTGTDYQPGGDPGNHLTEDYAYADWAVYNQIGDDPAGTWRTLTTAEWTYVFEQRPGYALLRGQATVCGVHGYMLLPDDWVAPADISFTGGTGIGFDVNVYSPEQWTAMEAEGAVFLSASGSRSGTAFGDNAAGNRGAYWSVSGSGNTNAYRLWFRDEGAEVIAADRNYGRPVRPVKDLSPVSPQTDYQPMPFSVAADRQVCFSPGNLQYNAARGSHRCADGSVQPGTWRFAERQWDYVGDAQNGTVYHNGTKCSNTNIGETYNGWIDLFGWGTSGWNSGANAWQPWAASVSNSDYYPGGSETDDLTGDYAYSDWARYNTIGYHPAGTWRTLAKDEWVWLFHERENAERLFGMGTVNGVQGTIILPDGWVAPVGIPFNASTDKGLEWNGTYYESSTKDIYSHNVYTDLQWGKMEAAGAVFLPAGGRRSGTTVNYASESGNYWSSSRHSAESAFRMRFYTHYLDPSYDSGENLGRSVRPVRDVEPPPPPSAYKPKPFSVSADRQVLFSPGNLQYNAALGTHPCADGTTKKGTWRFAEHQYDYVGDTEKGNVYANGVKCRNSRVSNTYDGWIDLFGWGTSGWNSGAIEYQPWAISQTSSDYMPDGNANNNLTGDYAYSDWGVYNAVGDDPAGIWRTLTKEEWTYLFRERKNADKLFGLGTVNGVKGTIILPDGWVTPLCVTFNASTDKGLSWQETNYANSAEDNYSHNTFTARQWEEQMAANGAVFLPSAGYRYGTTMTKTGEYGSYWSASACETEYISDFNFSELRLCPQYKARRFGGRSVRPVKDVVPPPPPSAYEPKPFSISAGRQVLFSPGNLQYNAALGTHQCADGTTQPGTWRFADHQWDYVGDAKNGTVWYNGTKCCNTNIGSDYNGWIDFFGWGTSGCDSGAKEYQPWATGKANDDYISEGYEESDLTGSLAWADWGMYNEINGDTPGTWRSLTKEESYYLLVGRANANQLFGFGTVNNIIGLILLPDEWTTPSEVTFASGGEKGMEWDSNSGLYNSDNGHFADNVYTGVQWQKMENAGAVFLPAAGYRRETTGYSVRESGNYWLASYGIHESSHGACYIKFPSNRLYPERHHYRYNGGSVRLVKDQTPPPPSAYIPQPFSVSADRQILFSSGNLQYNAAQGTHQCADGTTQQGTWRFAVHQWDVVGMGYGQTDKDNHCYIGGTVQNGDNWNISETCDGWTDLFGWGTSGWNSGAAACQPWATSVTNSDYHPGGSYENNLTGNCANADWGVYNRIGDDEPGTWRTLTYDEWNYLTNTRTNAGSKYGVASVNGMTGVVILPDDFTLPADCGFTPGMTNASDWYDWSSIATTNIYTSAQWQLMEAAGAVFLPCAGDRNRALVFGAGAAGRYWSSTANNSDNAYYLSFSSEGLHTYANYRYRGFSVRLVKDQTPPPPPSAYNPQPFSIAPDRQITFSPGNLQYNAAQGSHQCADGTTQQGTWRFAEHQWDYVGDTKNGTVYHNGTKCSNTKISSKYDGWIDLFAWGTSGWDSGAKNYRPWNEGKTNSNYLIGGKVENDMRGKYSYADWGVYNDIVNGTKTDPAGTWHTMTENDWAYIVLHRPNTAKLFALATVNGVKGMILLPDNWNPADKPHLVTSTEQGFYVANDTIYNDQRGSYETNILSATQWLTMEAAGAVFLPCAGHRHEKTLQRLQEWGDYTPSTNMAKRYIKSKYELPVFFFSAVSCKPGCPSNVRYCGKSIRLVSDYPPSSAVPPRSTTTVAADYWTPYTDYRTEEPDPWISTGHRTATAEHWTTEPERRTPQPERRTAKEEEDDPEEDTYVEEPKDTVCWQSSYRFHDYDYPLPSVTVCRDRDYVAYTLEYFDKDACTHYLKDIAIATTEGGTVELYDTICDGTTYDFFGDQLTKADVYTHTVPIAPGCEQVHILHLTVHPSYSGIEQTEHICPLGSFVWNGAEYTDEGDYTLSLSSANGCDSLVTLHLRHYPSYERQLTDTLLTGQTLLFEGTEIAEAGTYSVTLPSVDGCDSVITLMLEENAVQVLSAECNDLCSDKEELHISLDFTGTGHSVRLTFDSAAHVAGWRDTLIVLTDDGDIVLPARGRSGQFTCTAELLFRDTKAASVTIPFTLPYPSSVLKQLWDDGVAVMNADYNGGYDFVAFQWYENGVPLAGETASILYRPLIMGGEYSALLTESNGRQMLCCPLIATSRTALETPDIGITIWPTLAAPLETIRCHAEQPAELTVYDIHGRTVDRLTVPAGTSVFSAPVVPGLYMVLMHPLHSGRAATVKLMVIPGDRTATKQ